MLDIASVSHPVAARSLAYAPPGAQHRFAEMRTGLRVLVVFAGEPQ